MKYIHSIRIKVFSKPEDDEEKIKAVFPALIPFDLEKEKIELKTETVTGAMEQKINIFQVILQKQRHTQDFFKYLMSKLGEEQKNTLLTQKESRTDENSDFFIRLDKDKLLNGEYLLTDSGNCFHIKIAIAAFPARKETALKIIDKLFLE